jgi:hypothetical protein
MIIGYLCRVGAPATAPLRTGAERQVIINVVSGIKRW